MPTNRMHGAICDCGVIHDEVVEEVRKNMLDEKIFHDLGAHFKSIGDVTRLKIIYALSKSEMCVCDIAAVLNMTPSAISHQLKILKQSRLAKSRKHGKVVYYSLQDDHIKHICDQGLIHIYERQ